MVQLSADIPASLKAALEEKAARSSGGVSSIVTAALARDLEKPIHTIFQVSTSGALVAGVYDREVSVALPWAIAAALVRPSEKILSISRDGGFLYSAMELETAVRLKVNLVHLVWVDGAYDMVATQERLAFGRTSGVDFGPVDYVKYAEAFGAHGMMIKTPDDNVPVMKKAFDRPGPVIVGVHVDYGDNHKLFEMVRGDSIL